ncbi:hypothetical protein Tco_0096009, partial [Tanacetum coccineum]
ERGASSSAHSSAVPAIDPVSSAEDTEAFKTNEFAPTHVPLPRRRTARMSVQPHIPMSDTTEALITEYASAPTLPSSPPSPLSPLPSPPTTSFTYAEALLGYKAFRIRLRVVSPPIKDTITTSVATIYYT